MKLVECSSCQERYLDTGLGLMKHLREYHAEEKNLQVKCPSCNQDHRSLATLQRHWYAVHHKRKPELEICQPAKKVRADNECVGVGEESDAVRESVELPENNEDVEESVCTKDEDPKVSEAVLHAVIFQHQEEIVHLSSSDVQPSTSAKCAEQPEVQSDNFSGSSSESESDCESSDSEGEAVQFSIQQQTKASMDKLNPDVNPTAASFLLNLQTKCHIPKKEVRTVIKDTEDLVKNSISDFSAKICDKLAEKNINLKQLLDMDKEIASSSSKVFDNLRTHGDQEKYFQDCLGVVPAKPYPLGRTFKRVRRKKKSGLSTVLKTEDIMFVSVDDTVDQLINHPDYKSFVEEASLSQNSKFLDSYMKGEQCKKNKVLSEHPDAIRFVLYYDDLEVCAPLKSKSGKHKLGAFYMFLDNIPLKYRSKLTSIFLVALVNANHIKGKSYGMDAGLEKIVEVLKKFEEGAVLKSGKKVYGTLIAVIGDNLGSHGIGGFKEGFTANRPCRYCLATLDQVRVLTSEREDLLRNPALHKEQCEKVQTAKGKCEKLSTEYGINRDSLLNTLESFHVIDGLPPDPLHDFLEGALSLAVRRLLKHYLYDCSEKKFTLRWLNDKIRDFDFGYAEASDRPSELKQDHLDVKDNSTTIHQSACQLWLLATSLPLILGPLVDYDDKYFQNFLDILEICRIVFSVDITKWMVAYLQDLIELYLDDYKKMYGDLIPKQHYLTHYPRLILLMGSLVNYMCLRCEAKHKYFKKLVEMIGNYKNIQKTLSNKHQLSQAVAWRKSLRSELRCGPSRLVITDETEYKHLLTGIEQVIETNWLLHNGRKFVPDKCLICVGCDENSLPIFAKILKVVIYPSTLFICKKVTTVMKHIHLAAYQISIQDQMSVHTTDVMIMPHILHAHKVEKDLFVVLKCCAGGALF